MDKKNSLYRYRLAYVLVVMGGLALLGTLVALRYSNQSVSVISISMLWAEDTFRQCSRSAPLAEAPFWKPSHEALQVLEADLAPFMKHGIANGIPMPKNFEQYHRQYVGFSRKGERLIYGNFVPNQVYSDRDWSLLEKPILICDGGAAMWGIVYNPKQRKFEKPLFNGG